MTFDYFVYWIHADFHENPESQGYIGITNNPKTRITRHSNWMWILEGELGITIDVHILYQGTLESCEELEKTLRPNHMIGWNRISGGRGNRIKLDGNLGKPRGKYDLSNTIFKSGDERTDKQKKAAAEHSERMKNRTPYNKTPISINGVSYPSITNAMKTLKMSYAKIKKLGEL